MLSAPADAIEVAAKTERDGFAFSYLPTPPRPRYRSFFLSATGHCAFFFLLPHLASIRFFADEPPVKLYVSRIQSLNLKLTEPLYAPPPPPARRTPAAEGSQGPKSTGTKVLEAPGPEPESGGSTPAPAPEPAKAPVVSKRFELPAPTRQASPNQPVILQPPDPSIGVPVQQLPKVVAWNDPVLPRPKPKPFVTPGRREKAPEKPADLTAPPTLDIASRNGPPSTVNIGAAPSLPRPRLAMPPSRTAPIRMPDAPPAAPDLQGGEIATGVGDPANLLILSGNAGKVNELVAVPPGSNVPRTVAEGSGTGTGRGTGTSRGSGAGTGSGIGAGSGSGSGTGSGAGAGSGGTSAKGGGGNGNGSGAGSGTNGASAGTGSGSGTGAGSGPGGSSGGIGVSGNGTLGSSSKMAALTPLSPSPPAAAAPAGPMRRGQVRQGVFDVVVVQSAAAETQFRSFGILKGKPIYTVYLQLSLPKAWILQYCLPVTAAAASAVSGVVRLDDPQPVTPPYPIATVLSEMELQPKSSYTLIHGFLTAAGKFRDMTLLGKVDQQLSRLLQLLEKWEFQPARKGDAPAEVEVLLAIPPA